MLNTTLALPGDVATFTQLVFDGVKMGASVELNGVHLGVVTDQFLRLVVLQTPSLCNF
jgi:hypothetical protein